jgi:AraC family transcriptional activator of tynA and feaB
MPAPIATAPDARRWTTAAVEAPRRLDYWVGAICEAFLEMDCASREAGSFAGSLVSVPGQDIAFNQVVASTQDVYRTPRAIARGQAHPFYLIAQAQASWHVRQGARLLQLRPGDAVLVDSAQPYELHFPDSVGCLSIQVPRAWAGRWLRTLECSQPRVALRDQGWGRALSGLCLQLAGEPALAAQYPAQLLADQVGAMLACALEPAQRPAPRAGRADLVARADALLRERLCVPGLAAADVAAALQVSPRTLHRAFAAADATFMGRLRALRMQRAAELLAQPRLATVSVAEIGRRCGYTDPSHFAREFHRAWGLAPAGWRRVH